jgi:hypothetical protein
MSDLVRIGGLTFARFQQSEAQRAQDELLFMLTSAVRQAY